MKRRLIIGAALLFLAAAIASFGWFHTQEYGYFYYPSKRVEGPFGNALVREAGIQGAVGGNARLYLWINEIPDAINPVISGFDITHVRIIRADLEFVNPPTVWFVLISGDEATDANTLVVSLGSGVSDVEVSKWPSVPLLGGAWGVATADDVYSSHWFKFSYEAFHLSPTVQERNHRVTAEVIAEKGLPIELPPDSPIYELFLESKHVATLVGGRFGE